MFGELGEHLRIHQVRIQVVVGRLALERFGKFLADLVQVRRRGDRAGNDALLEILLRLGGPFFAEHNALHILRPAALRPAETAAHHVDDGFGKALRAGFEVHHVGGLDAAREKKQRHVADDLAAGRDLHDVAEELVHLGVSARDFRPAMRHAHAGGLFLEIGVLAAGHFVQINFRAAGLRRGVERMIILAHLFPVVGKFVQAPRDPARCRAANVAARRRWNSDSAGWCCRSWWRARGPRRPRPLRSPQEWPRPGCPPCRACGNESAMPTSSLQRLDELVRGVADGRGRPCP